MNSIAYCMPGGSKSGRCEKTEELFGIATKSPYGDETSFADPTRHLSTAWPRRLTAIQDLTVLRRDRASRARDR